MDRLRRLQTIWGWLPAFRAVAEAEHLPTASKALGVSPSALSRTIRLLEEDLGEELFDRVGRNLRLNAAGQELLAAVRSSMRQVDDVLQTVLCQAPHGPLHLSTSTAMIPILVQPALDELRQRHPDVRPWIYGPEASDRINDLLLSGQLDLALLEHPIANPQLSIVRLLELEYSVYAGPSHPLHGVVAPSRDEILEHDFVGPTLRDVDRFPPELQPKIGLRVYQMALAISFCVSGRYLAILPHRVASDWPGPPLWRVPGIELPPGAVFLATRPSLGQHHTAIDAASEIFVRLAQQAR